MFAIPFMLARNVLNYTSDEDTTWSTIEREVDVWFWHTIYVVHSPHLDENSIQLAAEVSYEKGFGGRFNRVSWSVEHTLAKSGGYTYAKPIQKIRSSAHVIHSACVDDLVCGE
jgi:hypothetical protein